MAAAVILIAYAALDNAARAIHTRRKPPARAPQSPPPGPGPGRPPRHTTGPVTHTIRVWACGCAHTWDGTGRLIRVTACLPRPTMDDELKDLLK